MTTKIQRLSSTFRSLALNSFHSLRSIPPNSSSLSIFNASLKLRRSLHSSCRSFATERISILSSSSSSSIGFDSVRRSSPFHLSTVQVRFRHYTKRDRGNKRRRFTPAVSKVKKTKMKPYSSYAQRFELLKDGTIKRWKAGKRHNAHAKSKEAKRRLRRTTLVHPTYAKTMKKLNFGG